MHCTTHTAFTNVTQDVCSSSLLPPFLPMIQVKLEILDGTYGTHGPTSCSSRPFTACQALYFRIGHEPLKHCWKFGLKPLYCLQNIVLEDLSLSPFTAYKVYKALYSKIWVWAPLLLIKHCTWRLSISPSSAYKALYLTVEFEPFYCLQSIVENLDLSPSTAYKALYLTVEYKPLYCLQSIVLGGWVWAPLLLTNHCTWRLSISPSTAYKSLYLAVEYKSLYCL